MRGERARRELPRDGRRRLRLARAAQGAQRPGCAKRPLRRVPEHDDDSATDVDLEPAGGREHRDHATAHDAAPARCSHRRVEHRRVTALERVVLELHLRRGAVERVSATFAVALAVDEESPLFDLRQRQPLERVA
jgi:hypothetical protein